MAENPIEEAEQKVEKVIKSEPWYVWAGAVAAAGVIVYYIYKRRAASSSATNTPATATATDTGAQGYDYQSGPVSNYPNSFSEVGVNGNNVPILPSGVQPIYDPTGGLVGYQQPPPTTSPAPPPTEVGIIRATQSSGTTSGYDSSHPGGVPFWGTPAVSGQALGLIPFGSQVTINGPAVSGGDNIPNDPNHVGSHLWFPVTVNGQTGYVSAYDISNVVTNSGTTTSTGHGGGGYHVPVNSYRNTVDQTTFMNGMHRDFDSYAVIGE